MTAIKYLLLFFRASHPLYHRINTAQNSYRKRVFFTLGRIIAYHGHQNNALQNFFTKKELLHEDVGLRV